MNTTYAQKSSTVQKAADSKAASVLDSSAQNESLQRKADMANSAAQRAEAPRPNNTGMPDNLKAGIESLSGFSMDDVRVHYNSSKPATVQALAYTQGTDIHVAPGQEKCLPHEAWHVAQQMAGRVYPTTNINGMPVNDNAALEHEADVMGEKAVQCCCEKKEAVKSNIQKCNVSQFLVDDVKKYFGINQDNANANVKINGINVNVLRKSESYYQITCNDFNQCISIWRELTYIYHNSRPIKGKENEDKKNKKNVRIDLVYNGNRTELWYGFYGEECKEYDGYIVAHGTDSNPRLDDIVLWNKLSVMENLLKQKDENWEAKAKKVDKQGFTESHKNGSENWESNAGFNDGDAVSKLIAERGRFECLEKIESDNDKVFLGPYVLSPKEVWQSYGSMLEYREVAKCMNDYFKIINDGDIGNPIGKATKLLNAFFTDEYDNKNVKKEVEKIIELYKGKEEKWNNLTVEKKFPIKNIEFIESMALFGDDFIGVESKNSGEFEESKKINEKKYNNLLGKNFVCQLCLM